MNGMRGVTKLCIPSTTDTWLIRQNRSCIKVSLLLHTEFKKRIIEHTANVQTIDSMEFDHVPNPAIISPEFLGFLNNRLKGKITYIFGAKIIEIMVYANKNLGEL